MFGEKFEKSDVKVFTTEERAEEFLIENGFVYGCPRPFKCRGWYYDRNVNADVIAPSRFVFATVDKVIIDEEAYYGYELNSYTLGKE